MSESIAYRPQVGERVLAFHPGKLGVMNYGDVVSVGRKYARIDFGPLNGGVFRVSFAHISESA